MYVSETHPVTRILSASIKPRVLNTKLPKIIELNPNPKTENTKEKMYMSENH